VARVHERLRTSGTRRNCHAPRSGVLETRAVALLTRVASRDDRHAHMNDAASAPLLAEPAQRLDQR
jgi:hypothetical protein